MRVPAVIMRGGTSKAVFFAERDLPADAGRRDRFILATYGSPDPYRRQIDGLGGATPITSKVAIIGDGAPHGVDVTYEFGQVAIDRPLVDRRGTCGNISSAVGPYAVDEGLVEVEEPVTRVRFLNVNTGKVIVAHVPVKDGRFDPRGDYEIPGVPGTGAAIRLDYVDPGGAVTGSLLPTGRVRDTVIVPGLGEIEISLVDAANPLVFVAWKSVGLTGRERPEEIDADPALLARLESIRAAASVLAGIAETTDEATAQAPSVPKFALVGPPADYRRTDDIDVDAGEYSVRASMMAMGSTHRSYPLTGAICTAVAAAIEGTVVAAAGPASGGGATTIGHPSGVLTMQATPTRNDGAWSVDSVSAYRTARRLMEGWALAPDEEGSVA